MPSFAHLRRLTDDTGLLEHALGRIPRRNEGYTTDDNARALWTITEWLTHEGAVWTGEKEEELHRLADIYLAFLLWSQRDNGWWHNNFAYDRSPEREEVSHDCQGRSFWACSDAWVRLKGPRRETAKYIVLRAMPTLHRIDSHRGQSFTMAACAHLLEAWESGLIDLPHPVRQELEYHLTRLERLLNGALRHFSFDDWQWFEPAMTYGNGVLPWAMLRTYRYTRRPETLKGGLDSLSCLLERMTTDEGWFRPVGNEAWCTPGNMSRWDQQPLEMFKLALALEEAALAVETAGSEAESRLVGIAATREDGFGGGSAEGRRGGGAGSPGAARGRGTSASRGAERVGGPRGELDAEVFRVLRDLCRAWYYGANDKQTPVADPSDGSCCDGLTRHGPNVNCGAEAVISYLMTEALCLRKSG